MLYEGLYLGRSTFSSSCNQSHALNICMLNVYLFHFLWLPSGFNSKKYFWNRIIKGNDFRNLKKWPLKVTRPSYFERVPSYFEALWYPHFYFDRESNMDNI